MALNIVMGVSGSGRTHFIEHHFNTWKHFSVGDYQRKLREENGDSKMMDFFAYKLILIKVNEQIQEDVVNAIKRGDDVVLEHTYYKAKRRIAYVEEFRKATDAPINIYVVMPSEEQFRNNLIKSPKHSEKDFDRLWSEMDAIEMPNIAEGYDKIFIVRDEKVEELITEIDPDLIDRVKKELAEEVALEAAKEKEKKEHQEFLEQLNEQGFWHYCEVCGKKEHLTPEKAFNKGWDYPPRMGMFGVLSPRTCGECGITETLWWKLATDKKKEHNMEDLTDEEKKTMKRILLEPYSLLEEEEDK